MVELFSPIRRFFGLSFLLSPSPSRNGSALQCDLSLNFYLLLRFDLSCFKVVQVVNAVNVVYAIHVAYV